MSENTKTTENVVIEEETLQETANLFFEGARKEGEATAALIEVERDARGVDESSHLAP